MSALRERVHQLDALIIRFMNAIGVPFLRIGIGVVFIWFGGLKTVGFSPAEELLAATVYWWTPEIVVPVIGYWEVLIGIFFLIPPLTRWQFCSLPPQMVGTFLPLVLLPPSVLGCVPFRSNPGGSIHHQKLGCHWCGPGDWLTARSTAIQTSLWLSSLKTFSPAR